MRELINVLNSISNPRRLLAIGTLPFLVVADLLQNHVNYLGSETRPKLIEDFKIMFYDFYYTKGELDSVKEKAEAKRIHDEKVANAYDVHEFNYRGHMMRMVVVRYGEVEDLPSNLLYDSQVIVHETSQGAKLKRCTLHDPKEAGDIYRAYVANKEANAGAKQSAAEKLANKI